MPEKIGKAKTGCNEAFAFVAACFPVFRKERRILCCTSAVIYLYPKDFYIWAGKPCPWELIHGGADKKLDLT